MNRHTDIYEIHGVQFNVRRAFGQGKRHAGGDDRAAGRGLRVHAFRAQQNEYDDHKLFHGCPQGFMVMFFQIAPLLSHSTHDHGLPRHAAHCKNTLFGYRHGAQTRARLKI